MQKANTQNHISQSKIWLILIIAITLLLAIFIWKYFEFKIEKVKQSSIVAMSFGLQKDGKKN